MIAEKVARDPVPTVTDLSRESGISRRTGGNVTFAGTLDHHQNVSIGGRVIKELDLQSRACERCQKLTARDKNKRLEQARGLLQQLRDRLRAQIFVDEVHFELNLYLNSTKDHIIEAVTGDARDAGINAHCRNEGLMILGVFVSDGRSWCHVYQRHETVSGRTFTTAMRQFFCWLGGDITENSLLIMDGAPAHTANATQVAMSRLMGKVGGAQLGKQD